MAGKSPAPKAASSVIRLVKASTPVDVEDDPVGLVEVPDSGFQEVERNPGDRDTDQPAQHPQHHHLGEELPDHAPAPRAQGATHRHFTLARYAASEQHVRDVGTGDQQHARDHDHHEGKHHRDLVGRVAVSELLHGRRDPAVLVGVLDLESASEGLHLLDRRFPGDLLAQVANHLETRATATCQRARVHTVGDPKVLTEREAETLRHHPDDLGDLSVHSYRASHHALVGSEAGPPCLVPEQERGGCARLVVALDEGAPVEREHAKHGKGACGHEGALVALGRTLVARKIYGAAVEGGQVLERGLAVEQVAVVVKRHTHALDALFRPRFPDQHQPLGIAHRQVA